MILMYAGTMRDYYFSPKTAKLKQKLLSATWFCLERNLATRVLKAAWETCLSHSDKTLTVDDESLRRRTASSGLYLSRSMVLAKSPTQTPFFARELAPERALPAHFPSLLDNSLGTGVVPDVSRFNFDMSSFVKRGQYRHLAAESTTTLPVACNITKLPSSLNLPGFGTLDEAFGRSASCAARFDFAFFDNAARCSRHVLVRDHQDQSSKKVRKIVGLSHSLSLKKKCKKQKLGSLSAECKVALHLGYVAIIDFLMGMQSERWILDASSLGQ